MQVNILRGISGSGKSTYIRANMPNALVVSADHYFLDADNNYNFDASKLGMAHADCFKRYITALINQEPLVAVDNTNTTAWECSPYVQGAAAFGYDYQIITLECDPDVAAKRNLHGVPRKSVLDMYKKISSKQLPPFWNHKIIK